MTRREPQGEADQVVLFPTARARRERPAPPLERYVATMLGSAVGDALGWPTEFLRRGVRQVSGTALPLRDFVSWQKLVGGRWWGYPETIEPGAYSDDTQLTLAVARCINDFGSFEPERFAYAELPLWLHYERGGGRAIKTAAHALVRKNAHWLRNFYRSGETVYQRAGANGAAMRTLPLALVNLDDDATFLRDCWYDALITHGHPRAIVGALAFGLAVRTALAGELPRRINELLTTAVREKQLRVPLEDAEIERWTAEWDRRAASKGAFIAEFTRTEDELLGNLAMIDQARPASAEDYYLRIGALDPATRGSGTATACAALFQLAAHEHAPDEAVIAAVNLIGSDTDTVASLTGALAGAAFGSVAVPARLAERVQDATYLRHTAARMHRIASGELGAEMAVSRRIERRDAYLQILAWELGLHEMFWDAINEGGVVLHPTLGRGIVGRKEVRQLRRPDYVAKLIHIAFDSGQSCVFHSRLEAGVRVTESLAEEAQKALA